MGPNPKSPADELAAWLDLPVSESERVERQARAVEGWLNRILAVGGGHGFTRDEAEAVQRVYDVLAGSQAVKRVRALAAVEGWLVNRQTAALDDLADALGEIDPQLFGIERALAMVVGDVEDIRGTRKRTGDEWGAKRVLVLLCHRVGALGFRRMQGTPIDSKTLKASSECLADEVAKLGDWPLR